MLKHTTFSALLLIVVCQTARAVVTYDFPSNNQISTEGRELGQTFTAPTTDNVLQSFTIRLKTIQPTTFDFNVAAWDNVNLKLIGPPLYTSPRTSQPSAYYVDFTITPDLVLVPGGSYIAYIDKSNYNPNNNVMLAGNGLDPYSGGAFVFMSSPQPETWIHGGQEDLAFAARFVPEPEWLSITGCLVFLTRARRAGFTKRSSS